MLILTVLTLFTIVKEGFWVFYCIHTNVCNKKEEFVIVRSEGHILSQQTRFNHVLTAIDVVITDNHLGGNQLLTMTIIFPHQFSGIFICLRCRG